MGKMPSLQSIVYNRSISESDTKKYKFLTGDNGDEKGEISADTPEEADEKIRKITGKDPKSVTSWSVDEAAPEDATSNISSDIPKLNVDKFNSLARKIVNIGENSTTSIEGGEVHTSRRPFSMRYKPLRNAVDEKLISEETYKEWKLDQSASPKAKINKSIIAVAKNLHEIERMVSRVGKLKTEVGANQDIYWKRTNEAFLKINERFLKIASKIRNISQ